MTEKRKVEIVAKLSPDCWPWFWRGQQVMGQASRSDVIEAVFSDPREGIELLKRMIAIESLPPPLSAMPRGNRFKKAARPKERRA